MKKFYNNPSMNISFFEQENIVTVSGETKSVRDTAKDWLTNEQNISAGNIADLLTF